jgi:putative holliday junction resolvase
VGRWLSLDVGEKRVGVALCDESHTLARPFLTLKRASKKEDFARLAVLCYEQQIEKIIVGLPKTLRNEEGPRLGACAAMPMNFRRPSTSRSIFGTSGFHRWTRRNA